MLKSSEIIFTTIVTKMFKIVPSSSRQLF